MGTLTHRSKDFTDVHEGMYWTCKICWPESPTGFVPEVNGKRVCEPYATQMEAEAFGSGYATALKDKGAEEVDVQIVTIMGDDEIERSPL